MDAQIIAYYTPVEGPVQKHLMWTVDWDDARSSKEGDRWSRTPPKKGDVEDLTPKPIEFKAQDASPPPVADRNAPGPALGPR